MAADATVHVDSNNRILNLSSDLLQSMLLFLNSYELIQLSLANSRLNLFISNNTIYGVTLGDMTFMMFQ